MSADRHWIALDRMFSPVLSRAQLSHARARFAHRAAALSDIHLPRLADVTRASGDSSGIPGQLLALQQTHQALTAALIVAWNEADDTPVI